MDIFDSFWGTASVVAVLSCFYFEWEKEKLIERLKKIEEKLELYGGREDG